MECHIQQIIDLQSEKPHLHTVRAGRLAEDHHLILVNELLYERAQVPRVTNRWHSLYISLTLLRQIQRSAIKTKS